MVIISVQMVLCALGTARKKSTKIKFLGPETARWGGGLPREGVVAENFVPALETLSSLGFEERNPGCPGNFAGMSRTPGGVQKVCAKKLRAHLPLGSSSVAVWSSNMRFERSSDFLVHLLHPHMIAESMIQLWKKQFQSLPVGFHAWAFR